MMTIYLSVRLSLKCVHKNAILSQKLSNLELWSLLTTYIYEVLHGLFIIGPQKFKMANIRHLENREIAISQRKIIRF